MGLKHLLGNSLGNRLDKDEVTFLINRCYTFALAYIRIKASSGKLYSLQSERLEDLAWDSIAELFERDQDGHFCVISDYFESVDTNAADETRLNSHLRKLVFTKVEDHLFKAAGENDPSLKKIIRNLKLAIRDQSFLQPVIYRDGFIFVGERSEKNLPMMPSEFLQMKLCANVEGKMQIPEILNRVFAILDNQHMYQKKVSLIALAIIIRYVFIHFHEESGSDQTMPSAENKLLQKEFEQFLTSTVRAVRFKVGYRYLEKKKLDIKILDAYTKAATSIVREQFTQMNDDISHYECLKKEIPWLQYEQFREKHRSVLEYLVKRIRSDIVTIYANEWQ